jgi:hypothetical protein
MPASPRTARWRAARPEVDALTIGSRNVADEGYYCGMWRRSPGPAARVPDLIGLEVRVAQDLALDAGVLAVEARPAVVRSGVVTGQNPGPGRRVRVGSSVWIRVGPRAEPDDGPGNGGGGGRPRLPQGPRPWSPTGHKPVPR